MENEQLYENLSNIDIRLRRNRRRVELTRVSKEQLTS